MKKRRKRNVRPRWQPESFGVAGAGPAVAWRTFGRTTEYVGVDGYWTRRAEDAAPFPTADKAWRAVEQLREAAWSG